MPADVRVDSPRREREPSGRSRRRRLDLAAVAAPSEPRPTAGDGDDMVPCDGPPDPDVRTTVDDGLPDGAMLLEGLGSVAALVTSLEFAGVSVDHRAAAAANAIAQAVDAVGNGGGGDPGLPDELGVVLATSLVRGEDGSLLASVRLRRPRRGKNRAVAVNPPAACGPADPLRHHLLRLHPAHAGVVDTMSELLCASTAADYTAFEGPGGEEIAKAHAEVHRASEVASDGHVSEQHGDDVCDDAGGCTADVDVCDDTGGCTADPLGLAAALPDLANAARFVAANAPPKPAGFAEQPMPPAAGMSLRTAATAAPAGHEFWIILAVDEAESRVLLAPETPDCSDVGACRWLRCPADDVELHIPADFDPQLGVKRAETTRTALTNRHRRIRAAKAGGGDMTLALAAREGDMVAAVTEGKLERAARAQASATLLREAIHIQRTLAAMPDQAAMASPLPNVNATPPIKIGSVVSARLPGHSGHSAATVLVVHSAYLEVRPMSASGAVAEPRSVDVPRPLRDVWVVPCPMDAAEPAVAPSSGRLPAAPTPTHQGDSRRFGKTLRALMAATLALWVREKVADADQLRSLAGMAHKVTVALAEDHVKSRRARARDDRTSAACYLSACGDQQAAFVEAVDELFARVMSTDPTERGAARDTLSHGLVGLCEKVAPEHLRLVTALLRRHVRPRGGGDGEGRGRARYARFSTSPSDGRAASRDGDPSEGADDSGERRYYTAEERAKQLRGRVSAALMATVFVATQSSGRLALNVSRFLGAAAWIHNVPKQFRELLSEFGVSLSSKRGKAYLMSRAKGSAQVVAAELERLRTAKGVGPVDRLWSMLDNLNLHVGKDNQQTAASQAINPPGKNFTAQVLAKMSPAERFDDVSSAISRHIVVGRGSHLHGQSLSSLKPCTPTGTRLPVDEVPEELRNPAVSRVLSKSLSDSLFHPDNAVTAGSVVQPKPVVPGPRCCGCPSPLKTARRNAGKHLCLRCEKAGGAAPATDICADESGLHPLTGLRVWKGTDQAQAGCPSVYVYEISTSIDALIVCPDLADPSDHILCPMRDQTLAEILRSQVECSVGSVLVAAVEHGNAGFRSMDGPRNKGTGPPSAFHRQAFPECCTDDGQRKSFTAVLPRVCLPFDEGTAAGLAAVLGQVNVGPAENVVSAHGLPQGKHRHDDGRFFHAQDQKTSTGSWQFLLDTATMLDEGPAPSLPGVSDDEVVAEHLRVAAQAAAHNPGGWQFHQGLNCRDAASKTGVDRGVREVEAACLHATAQRLDKVAQNVRGKRDHEKKEAAVYGTMLVRRYNDDVPSDKRPVPPPDEDGWVSLTINRGSKLIAGMGRSGQAGTSHPRGGRSPAGSIVINDSPTASLVGAAVCSIHLRGAGIASGRTTAMPSSSGRRAEVLTALDQAVAGTGTPVVVVCRVKVGTDGECGDHAEAHAAMMAAWAAYNRAYTCGAMDHARQLVAASKDMHPGPVPGCDFARWVTQWFDRLTVQDVLQRGGKGSDFDLTTVADLAMLKLFANAGGVHHGTHLRLNAARLRVQSHQCNVVRMALPSVPWTEGGEPQFWDAIQEIFIDMHQAATSPSMTAARVLDVLTVMSLNVDLIYCMGELRRVLMGACGPAPPPRGGLGSVRRGDVNALFELYERAGSHNINGSGGGVSQIDRFRVAATAVPVVLDQEVAQECLGADMVHKTPGLAGHYIETNFNERLSFLVPGDGHPELVAAKV